MHAQASGVGPVHGESVFPCSITTDRNLGLEPEWMEPSSVCFGGAESWDLTKGPRARSLTEIPWLLVQLMGVEKKGWSLWDDLIMRVWGNWKSQMTHISSLGHWVGGLTIHWHRKHRRGEDVKFSLGLIWGWVTAGHLEEMSIKQLDVHVRSLGSRQGLETKVLAMCVWKSWSRQLGTACVRRAMRNRTRGNPQRRDCNGIGEDSSLLIRCCSLMKVIPVKMNEALSFLGELFQLTCKEEICKNKSGSNCLLILSKKTGNNDYVLI